MTQTKNDRIYKISTSKKVHIVFMSLIFLLFSQKNVNCVSIKIKVQTLKNSIFLNKIFLYFVSLL